jgi:dynein heavy chain
VGLGDNGRKTIARIAAFLNDYSVFRIEPFKQYGAFEWQEDLKTLHKSLGIDNKKIVFLLADNEIK